MTRGVLTKQANQLIYPRRYEPVVFAIAEQYGVEENLVFSIMKAESGFYPYACSPKKAKGLMQLSENTWELACDQLDLAPDSIYDRESNIRAGVWYYAKLYREFQDENLALIAYNAGPTRVRNWIQTGLVHKGEIDNWKIPFQETSSYLQKVQYYKNKYAEIYGLEKNHQSQTHKEGGDQ